jgi:hypothetical protein
LMSVIVDLLLISLAFRYDCYTAYQVGGVTVLSFGGWFKEQCAIFDLKEGKHYLTVERGWPWLRRVQWFRRAGVVRPRPGEADIEAGSLHHHHNKDHQHQHHGSRKSTSPSPEDTLAKVDELLSARSTSSLGGTGSMSFYQKRMSALNKASQGPLRHSSPGAEVPSRSNSTSPAPG